MRASSSRAFAAASAEPTTSAMGVPLGTRNPVHVENSTLPSPMFRLPGKCPAPKEGPGRVSIIAAPACAAFFNSLFVSACSDGSSPNCPCPPQVHTHVVGEIRRTVWQVSDHPLH